MTEEPSELEKILKYGKKFGFPEFSRIKDEAEPIEAKEIALIFGSSSALDALDYIDFIYQTQHSEITHSSMYETILRYVNDLNNNLSEAYQEIKDSLGSTQINQHNLQHLVKISKFSDAPKRIKELGELGLRIQEEDPVGYDLKDLADAISTPNFTQVTNFIKGFKDLRCNIYIRDLPVFREWADKGEDLVRVYKGLKNLIPELKTPHFVFNDINGITDDNIGKFYTIYTSLSEMMGKPLQWEADYKHGKIPESGSDVSLAVKLTNSEGEIIPALGFCNRYELLNSPESLRENFDYILKVAKDVPTYQTVFSRVFDQGSPRTKFKNLHVHYKPMIRLVDEQIESGQVSEAIDLYKRIENATAKIKSEEVNSIIEHIFHYGVQKVKRAYDLLESLGLNRKSGFKNAREVYEFMGLLSQDKNAEVLEKYANRGDYSLAGRFGKSLVRKPNRLLRALRNPNRNPTRYTGINLSSADSLNEYEEIPLPCETIKK